MTPEQIRRLIIDALARDPGVVSARPTTSVFSDRTACAIEDHAGRLWRVRVLLDPVERVEARG